MTDRLDDILKSRKDEHINIVLENDVETKRTTWLENIILIHKSLPEIDLDNVDLQAFLFGKKFSAPILIESMTGGTKLGAKINKNLANIAQEYNIPMGLGSQRAGLRNRDTIWTYKVARDIAPDAFLIGNIGAPQLHELTLKDIDDLISMIEADALAIHLNALQEVIQWEGDTNYSGILAKIREITDYVRIPVIVKETGAGISKETAQDLVKAGVDGIDVAGVGGTSWSAVEYYRARNRNNEIKSNLGKIYWDWGIPTAASILEVKTALRQLDVEKKVHIIGSGGIRTGLDAAKSLVLGADFVGMAKPFLKPAIEGTNSIKKFLNLFLDELRIALFLTGSKNISELRNASFVILSPLKDWIKQRKLII